MEQNTSQFIKSTCQKNNNDRGRMMDIISAVQTKFGHVSSEAMDIIAQETKSHRVEVESVVTFYAFFSKRQKGKRSFV